MLITHPSRTELTRGLPTGIKGVTLPAGHSLWEAGGEQEDQYALDNSCNSARFVAFGARHFLHFRWIHPHSVGGGRHRGPVSVADRPKNRLIAEMKQMKAITLIGIVLVVLGALALAYQGITFTRTEKVLDLGPIHATQETQDRIPVPPILGGVALIGGVALLVVGRSRRVQSPAD